jgi:hypothetical protein
MSSWTNASSVSSKNDIPFKFDAFDQLRKKIRLRYDTLVAFRQEQGSLPIRSFSEYLKTKPDLGTNSSTESSHDFLSRSFPTAQLLRNVTASSENRGSFLGLQTSMEPNKSNDPSLSRKRKVVDDHGSGLLKQVSWNDQPMMRSTSPGVSHDGVEPQEFPIARVKREEDSC